MKPLHSEPRFESPTKARLVPLLYNETGEGAFCRRPTPTRSEFDGVRIRRHGDAPPYSQRYAHAIIGPQGGDMPFHSSNEVMLRLTQNPAPLSHEEIVDLYPWMQQLTTGAAHR